MKHPERLVGGHPYNPPHLLPLVEIVKGEKSSEEAVKEAFQNKRLKILVLKDGSRGSKVYTREGQGFRTGVYKIHQIDATGAGDSFDAAFLCGLLQKKSLQEAARMGAAAGALNAAAFGPMEGDISPDTLRNMMEKGEGI